MGEIRNQERGKELSISDAQEFDGPGGLYDILRQTEGESADYLIEDIKLIRKTDVRTEDPVTGKSKFTRFTERHLDHLDAEELINVVERLLMKEK